MLKLFDENNTVPVVLSSQEEAVLLAADDLRRDLLRISGKKDGFPLTDSADGPAIRIRTESGEPESYSVRVTADGIDIFGADTLGTVYGIYRVSRELLGVEPMHRLTGLEPKQRDRLSVPDAEYSQAPAPVRFRGWFLNDEDLLTDFCPSGGKRNIRYRFYQNVMSVSVLDRVLESALRCGMNLIIPGSFVDLSNPPEEALLAACCRRGLYVTMHHIEPMGVSVPAAENWLTAHGMEDEVSYVRHPEILERIWRESAERWAKYGSHVIWQLGLRGKGDVPVWASDPSVPDTPQAHGKLIGDAIALQYRIVCETLGTEDFLSTVTLWEEGAELYRTGALQLPPQIAVIFADVGVHQMMAGDFHRTVRRPGTKYGVYYHIAYYGWGPHLAEGCSDEKQVWNYCRMAEKDTLWYSVLNVSNLREMHMGARVNAAILHNPSAFDAEAFLSRTYREIYGSAGEKMAALRREYFSSMADLGYTEAHRYCTQKHFSDFYDYGELPFLNYEISDGVAAMLGKRFLHGQPSADSTLPQRLREGCKRMTALYEKLCAAETEIPESAQEYFRIFPKLQALYLRNLYAWAVCCAGIAEDRRDPALREKAIRLLQEILDARQVAAQGEFSGWYAGDGKIGVANLLTETERYARPDFPEYRQTPNFTKQGRKA